LKFIIKAKQIIISSNTTKEITITFFDDIQYIMGLLRLLIADSKVSKIATAGSIGTNVTVNVGPVCFCNSFPW
jgi:hypothetical protein